MLRKNKRADATDIFLFLIIIFFLAVSFVVVGFANSKIKSIIDTTALNESAAYSSISSSFGNINDFVVQRGFLVFFGILIIGMMVSAFLIRVHPVFIFLYIITLGVSIFVGIYLANTYEIIVSNGQFALLSENYAMLTFVMQNIATILLAVGALSMIIIFSKITIGSGGGSNDL